jgi:hypothetical protein
MKVMNGLIRGFLRTSHFRSKNPAVQRAAETDRDAQLRSIDTRAGPELRTAERQPTPAARRTPWTHALDARTKSRLSETSHSWQDFRSMLGSHPAVQLAMVEVTCSLLGTAWPAGRDRNLIGLHKIRPAGEGGWHFWLVRCSARQMLPADCCGWRR